VTASASVESLVTSRGLMFKRRIAWVSTALFCLSASVSLADGPVEIGAILKDPDSYNLRVVTLEGTVRDVKPYEPYYEPFQCGSGVCYGAYTFTLVDETGSIEVAHTMLSKKQGVKVPEISEGERVVIEAQILAPGRFIEESRGTTEERKKVQAVVKNMRRPITEK
jgi:hypothetical protein